MILLALLLLQNLVETPLLNESIRIGPLATHIERPVLKQRKGIIRCAFAVRPPGKIRVAIVRERDLASYLNESDPVALMRTGYEQAGEFDFPVPETGAYAIVFENREPATGPVAAQVRVGVAFADETKEARYLTPERRFAVVLISLLIFATLAYWCGGRVIEAFRQRQQRTSGQFPPF